jgi:hypothetical protein
VDKVMEVLKAVGAFFVMIRKAIGHFFTVLLPQFWQWLKKVLSHVKPIAGKVHRGYQKGVKFLSPSFLTIPRQWTFWFSMALFSFLVIALETVFYHLLQVLTNYTQTQMVIAIAMLGIAAGSLIAFYLGRINVILVMSLSALGLFISVAYAYYNVINIPLLGYPILLIFPFIFASIIVSSLFAHGNSNKLYFTNLLGSALGVIFPIIFVPLLKSETAIMVLMILPLIFLAVIALSVRFLPFKVGLLILGVMLATGFSERIEENMAYPLEISKEIMEEKILAELPAATATNFSQNIVRDFFGRVYTKGEDGYAFGGDEYDHQRVKYFLEVLGLQPRFDLPFLDLLDIGPQIEDETLIPANLFERELTDRIKAKYSYYFQTSEDRYVLETVYKLNEERGVYELQPGTLWEQPPVEELTEAEIAALAHSSNQDREAKRAKYILTDLGHLDIIDINNDTRPFPQYLQWMKIYNDMNRVLLSEDHLLGRLEYLGESRSISSTYMVTNGAVLDVVDNSNGTWRDPRTPWMRDAKVFIIGLSADGIVKSAKRLPGDAEVHGIEIIPATFNTMIAGDFADYAAKPYEDVTIFRGEGRGHLKDTEERYDQIYLMNIHMEHGPVSSYAPEAFHTVEGTELLLNRLTDRGYICYEEILYGHKSEAFFKKFINTAKVALRNIGVTEPEKHFLIYRWDFGKGGDAFRTLMIKKTPFTDADLAELEPYFTELGRTSWLHGYNMDYRPDAPAGGPYDKFILGEVLSEENKFSWSMPTMKFHGEILQKLSTPDDINFILRAYPRSRYGYHYLDRSWMDAADVENLKRILDRVGIPHSYNYIPATDDQPFPFDVEPGRGEIMDILWYVGILSLFLIVPVVLLLLGKRGQYQISLTTPNIFVAVTGFAYMMVQIVLIQKFQLFIGSPTYGVIVVLGGMLLFSGIGSLASHYMSKKTVLILTGLIPVFLIAKIFWLDEILASLSYLDLNGKLIASALLIFPLMFLIGLPFPNLLEAIKEKTSAEYGVLLFGVSGAFSTLGVVFTMYNNIASGYSSTFYIGAAFYFIGLILFGYILWRTGALSGGSKKKPFAKSYGAKGYLPFMRMRRFLEKAMNRSPRKPLKPQQAEE